MCEPTTIILVATAVVSAAGAVASHVSKDKAAAENKKLADQAATSDHSTISLREMQEKQATVSSVLDIERQVQQQKAAAAVSAGEAGVSGASVQSLLSLIETDGDVAVSNLNSNLNMTRQQLALEGVAVGINRQSRINGVAKGSWIETGLKISGSALGAAGGISGNTPIRGGG